MFGTLPAFSLSSQSVLPIVVIAVCLAGSAYLSQAFIPIATCLARMTQLHLPFSVGIKKNILFCQSVTLVWKPDTFSAKASEKKSQRLLLG